LKAIIAQNNRKVTERRYIQEKVDTIHLAIASAWAQQANHEFLTIISKNLNGSAICI
jgi:hypothetical protein